MKLYYVPRTRATRPRWLLEELGVPYELVRLDSTKGETRSAEHLARQPLGHVPVLEDGEVRLFESAAICLWLAERFPEKGLSPPAGTAARARVLQWVLYAMTELEPPLGSISAILRRPEAERDPRRIAEAKERFLVAARPLEPVLAASAHVAGPDFTVADVIVGSVLSWGKAAAGGLDELPAVAAYVLRMKARPALRRAVAD
jgi:glutathione S-transferase